MKKRLLAILLSAAALMPLTVGLSYAADEKNSAPTVIPAIREWDGKSGRFELGESVAINVDDATISEAKKGIIVESFENYLGISASFTSGDGDIVFITDDSDKELGDDGYALEITKERIIVRAPSDIGFLYSIYTVLQSVYADGYVPCGSARDYSYYKIRGGMLDVARAWLPLEYVEEITKYFAFFKLNEIHLHINDRGANNYSAFRLESDVEGLTAKDGYYTKDEYRAYQKRMLEYGVEVITEIDTPAHSACFAGVDESLMLDSGHLDISKPEVIQFVKDLFDEYMTGDDPVFVSKRVHIGTDEYPDGYNELMRKYTDELIEHINSRGYIPRFWGSFGNKGFNGSTPVSSDAETNFWAVELSDYKTLFDMGYDVINTCGPVLYIVPGQNYGFADYLNLGALYSTWYVNYMGHDSSTSVDADHPQLLGANFALWNDLYTEYSGFSVFDIFDRLRGGVCLIAEKTWCGEQTKNIDSSDFVERYETLSLYSAEGDAGRHNVSDIDGAVPEGVRSFGWPYVASFDVTVAELGDGVTLLGGEDGELYASKNGQIGFKRGVYNFTYNYRLAEGKSVNVKLVATDKKTTLIIDDTYFYEPKNTKNISLTRSSTFVLPLEQLGDGENVKVENILVKSETLNLSDRVVNGNYALYKNATVSGLEVDDGRFTPDMALDGNVDTRLSFSAKADYQWLVVDLGAVRSVSKVVIQFKEHISDYKVSVSTDGENYTEVAHIQKGEDRAKQTDTITFDATEARYIKYEQLKRFHVPEWNAYYSGGITEFEVYGFDKKPYRELVNEAIDLLGEGASNTLRSAMQELDNYIDSEYIYDTHLDSLVKKLEREIDEFKRTSNEDVSDVGGSDTSTPESTTKPKKAWPFILLGAVTAAVVGGVALVLGKKKK